jgi:ribosomal protein S3
LAEAATEFGRIGVKVWIYKGEIFKPSAAAEEALDDMAPIEVTVRADEETESNAPTQTS